MSKSKNEMPNASEFGQLRAYLAKAGVSQKQIKEVIGGKVNNRTRAQITEILLNWLRTLPKGSE